jgi:hypothetical protein
VPSQSTGYFIHCQTQAKVTSRRRQQCLLGLLFNPDEGNILLQNIGLSANYTALKPTRLYSLYTVFTMHDSK